jgi:hypothetical protein
VVVLPILLSTLAFRLLMRKGYTKMALLLPVLILGITFYFVFTAFYPNDDFYIENFEENTGVKFPASGTITKKEATYPDIHGSYTSRAIVELPASDYASILKTLQLKNDFTIDTSRFPFLQETTEMFNSKQIDETTFSIILIGGKNAQMKIGFLKDGKTIVFERHSS